MDRARCSTGGSTDGDERTDLEAALSGVSVDRRVGVAEQCIFVVAAPPIEKRVIPIEVDLARVRGGWPVRDSTSSDEGNLLGDSVGCPSQRFTERPCAMQGSERRTLAVDVGGITGRS